MATAVTQNEFVRRSLQEPDKVRVKGRADFRRTKYFICLLRITISAVSSLYPPLLTFLIDRSTNIRRSSFLVLMGTILARIRDIEFNGRAEGGNWNKILWYCNARQ